MSDLHQCYRCKAVMEPDIELQTDTMEFWGAPVTRTLRVLVCSECGSDDVDECRWFEPEEELDE